MFYFCLVSIKFLLTDIGYHGLYEEDSKVGGFKKWKCWILISSHCFPIPLPCGRYQKKFETFWTYRSSPSGTPQNDSGPFIGENKIHSDYRVHGIQIDRLKLTISTQKLVIKNLQEVPRYYKKSVKIRPSKPNQQNLTHFGWYLKTRCIYLKTDVCFETVSPSRLIWIPWTLYSERFFFHK